MTGKIRSGKSFAAKLVAAALMAACAVSQAATPTDYIQENLIACWDGYENAGTPGLHLDTLTEWKDTSGKYAFKFNEGGCISVATCGLGFPGTDRNSYALLSAADTALTFDLARNGTLEIVLKSDEPSTVNAAAIQSSTTAGMLIASLGGYVLTCNTSKPWFEYDWSSALTTFAVDYTNGLTDRGYLNGASARLTGGNRYSGANDGTTLGHRSDLIANWALFKGTIYAIRIYSKQLTADQVAANRAIDVRRFVEGDFAPVQGVWVSGAPDACAESGLPVYGKLTYAIGEDVRLAAPAEATDGSGNLYHCTGWKLYDKATGDEIAASDELTKLLCSFTYANPVSLVWQWAKQTMITVRNFDEDLATMYVNNEPTTNGQKVAVEGSVKIELRNFRSDYYFRHAPASQEDRTLDFESWEGVPAGYEDANPATFDVTGDLTIIPNVNVKGYAWVRETVDSVDQLRNDTYRWKVFSVDAATRTILANQCMEDLTGSTENDRVVDFVQRVSCNGKNYTITGFAGSWPPPPMFQGSHAGTWAVAPRFNTFSRSLSAGSGYQITNCVGFSEMITANIAAYAFGSSSGFPLIGDPSNYVPLHAKTIGDNAYYGVSGGARNGRLKGELVLDAVETIGAAAFQDCTELTAARLVSPNLQTIGNSAFKSFMNWTDLKEVTFGSSIPGGVGAGAFGKETVTNFVFLAEAPAATTLDDLLYSYPAADGDHYARLTVDAGKSNWWKRVTALTAAEREANPPADCMGAYVTAGGERKAWIVSSAPLQGVLLVGDMLMSGYDGFTSTIGLSVGQRVTLVAPEGYLKCDLQHLVDGEWKTYGSLSGASVEYEHQGEFTRAVWGVDGVSLLTAVDNYNGSVQVEVVSGELVSGDNVYSKGTVVRLTAIGHQALPASHFDRWTKGIAAADVSNATVLLTLTENTEVNAAFSPDEWKYASGQLTDGEWTCAATLSGEEISILSVSIGQHGVQPFDLSLPVRDADDESKTYVIAELLAQNLYQMRKVRVGSRFRRFASSCFNGSTLIESLDGLGASSVTNLPNNLFWNLGACPMGMTEMEAGEFIPSGLATFGDYCISGGIPYLVGTLEFAHVRSFDSATSSPFLRYDVLRDKLYNGATGNGVTNLLLTCEDLAVFPKDLFAAARLESVTIASTNLTTAASQAFTASAKTLKEMTFLAHAPAVAALDNLVKAAGNTNMVIRCSKRVPGWRELCAEGYKGFAEWSARPAGCWGIYQTADGQKRFYLVQKDSKYDVRKGFSLILK